MNKPSIQMFLAEKPDISGGRMTAARIMTIIGHDKWAILPVTGDCMERAGIEDGGWVAVDFTHMPRTPKYGKDGYMDPCVCLATWPGKEQPMVMVKDYTGKWGPVHLVGTRYDNWKGGDWRMDVGLFAKEIYGVVFASWGRDGALKWERDLEGYPEELPSAPTVRGVNIGEPEVAV